MIELLESLTPREQVLMDRETEEARNAREHEVTIKRLELETRATTRAEEIEASVRLKDLELQLKREEAKLKRLPLLILKLPLIPFLGLAYIFTTLLRREVAPEFWDFLR